MEHEVAFKRLQLPSLSGYRKVLVVGLGGGCDVISAYLFSKILEVHPEAVVIIGDSKESVVGGIQPLSRGEKTFTKVFLAPPTDHFEKVPDKWRYYALTCTIPKDPSNSPWIFISDKDEETLREEVVALGFDLIIGIDAGGDSLVEEADSGMDGQDKRMLRVLKSTGVPLIHVILGFGSDGESTEEEILKALKIATLNGSYKGIIDLDPMAPLIRDHCSGWLGSKRTPMIIMNAIQGTNLDKRPGDKVRVDRYRNPIIPLLWLQKGFIFDEKNLFWQ
eukprot:TRINITY_DN3058_c0_g1_i1.p1 TRINITY_DN3058_c0_g1~~TRINITY_DN3058_c0_g1_i1.p1  ORF type:complete len:277 (+),score=85.13 TRINITY_DN3058_c0_g1_i1:76-906(+)